jgi:hypothetical protein
VAVDGSMNAELRKDEVGAAIFIIP